MPESIQEWESKLIARLRKGEKGALKILYGLYFKTLRQFAFKLVRDNQEAEDIATDAFLTYWEVRGSLRSLHNIRAFLYVAVRNASYDFLRHAVELTAVQQEMLYLFNEQSKQLQFIEMENSLLEKIYGEIELLPPQCRQVFKLFYLENLSTSEIAELMKLSPYTVRNHKQRAVRELKSSLLKKGLLPLALIVESLHTWPNGGEGLAGWLGLG